MSRLIMGYWDCPVCGNKEIRGDAMNCPSCGRARGDVKFYLKGNVQGKVLGEDEIKDLEYLTEEQKKNFDDNPDWYCSFCNSLNKDRAAFCSNCGATREDSESNYFDQLNKREAAAEAERQAQQAMTGGNRSSKSGNSGRKKVLGILAAAVILVVLLVTYLNGNTTRNETVTGFLWERVIPIEENTLCHESAWSLPEGAELTSQKQEIHHYDKVLDHYERVAVQRSRQVSDGYETYYTTEDAGNGTFRQVSHSRPIYRTEYYTDYEDQPVYRDEPRYQTKYYYDIWRWMNIDPAVASGQDQNPVWPEVTLRDQQREGTNRGETYVFTVANDKGESTAWVVSQDVWEGLKTGESVNITQKRSGADPYLADDKGNPIAPLTKINLK